MDAVKTILAVIGGYSLASSFLTAYQILFGDRTGNSGRYKHWTEEDDHDNGATPL